MAVANVVEITDIRASLLVAMDVVSITSEVPKTRWVLDGGRDTNTAKMSDWIEPTVRFVDELPSRGARESAVEFEVSIAVRRGANIHRREDIAQAIERTFSSKVVDVHRHSTSLSSQLIGRIRFEGARYVNGGEVAGIHRGVVTVSGRFYPTD